MDVKIIPIFNQAAPGIWDDFLRIRAAAMQHNYNVKLTDAELARYMQEYQNQFTQHQCNVAYGAFENDNMVGFTQGYVVGKFAQLESLYVQPECQGQRVGHRLLKAAESSFAPICTRVGGVALGYTDQYYKAHGYDTPLKTNLCEKKLKKPACQRIALFSFNPTLARLCKPVAPNGEDISALAGEHFPIWTEFDEKNQARGILIANPETNRPILTFTNDNSPQQLTARGLKRSLDEYRQIMDLYSLKYQR